MEIIHLVLTKNTYIILNRFTKFPFLRSTYIFRFSSGGTTQKNPGI
jgi:hypothetical protein